MSQAPIHDGELADGHPLKEGTPQPPTATAADVTDSAMVPRHLAMLTSEVRSGFATMNEKILPTLDRLSTIALDHGGRLFKLEQARHGSDDQAKGHAEQLVAIEKRLARLEKQSPARPKARIKRKARSR